MLLYIVKRLGALLPVWIIITLITFLLMHAIPSNAIQMFLGTQVQPTPTQMEELKRLFGMDKPLLMQYWDWLTRALRGDLGYSLRSGHPISASILARIPITFELTILALLLGIAVGLPLGTLSALKRNSFLDLSVRFIGTIGISIPDFWLATLLVFIFSDVVPFVSIGNFVAFTANPLENLKIMILPAFSFGIGLSAVIMRFTRSSVLETLQQDYVNTARAKGLKEGVILKRHVLRNALIPVITVIGFYAGALFGGTVVIEQIFALPGLGRFALYAIYQRDYSVILAVVVVTASAFVLLNFVVDLLYGYLDPRIRYN